ncbi:hypothetical protein ACGF5O_15485 [Streptomyces sp. NPDC048291]|uniref:hypothetical protein n=1 Tax=Streptomyces sp. NPDC048291 TaxID=3365530 RepID=UPI00371053F9
MTRSDPVSDTPTIRLLGSLHLRPEQDGGAQVIDDTTFTAAHCSPAEATAPVARLLADLTAYGWIERS